MIYFLALLLTLKGVDEPVYVPMGPVGPAITDCVKFAQYVIPERVAKGDVKSYQMYCVLQAVPQ